MKIAVLITTHNRPEMLLQLLKDIDRVKGNHIIITIIIADGPQGNYKPVHDYIDKNPARYFFDQYPEHGGKMYYYRLVNNLYQMCASAHCLFRFDYFIQVPDDVTLADNFFNEAIDQFEAIKDPDKICMNLLNDGRKQPGWTHFKPVNVKSNGYTFIKTNWIDMCFISNSNYFKALDWKILPVELSWSGSETCSSGVGLQISKRLFELGKTMYLTSRSLVGHGAHNSQMHPEHRKDVPLISVVSNEKIVVGMASIVGRIESLKEVVASLLPQIDKLYIMLNGYDKAPEFLNHPKIQTFTDITNTLGDAGKFVSLHEKGYLFFCDDDIIYPPDYIQRLISAIERTNRKAIITIHGRQFKNFPVSSYYHDNSVKVSCLNTQLKDDYLHVPGTGVSAFHSDTIKLSMADFKSSNMADIWLALAAQKQKVPILSIAHQKGWLKLSCKYDEAHSIYSLLNRRDQYQTKIVNSINWTLNTLQNEQSNTMA